MKYIILILFVSLNAGADVNCFGKVTNVFLAKNGLLTLHTTWKGDYVAACSVTSEWKGVPVEVCKGWLAVALTAQATQEQTVMQYGSLDVCSDVDRYSAAPSPNYLMLYGKD